MHKNLIKLITICALAAFAATTTITVRAEDKPAAAAEPKKDRAIPFSGKINEIDQAAKTISIGKDKKRTIHITDKTKVMKDGKPATLADAKVGDEVGGSYRDNSGKMEAGSLRIGPKPEGKPEAKKKKE
jgi:hypothetical protein